MGKLVKLIGVDISLNNLGMSAFEFDITNKALRCVDCKLIKTESTQFKKEVRKNSDDLSRAKVLLSGLNGYIEEHAGNLVMVEIPVGSQSARAMCSYGLCLGVLAGSSKPLIQVTPKEVKLAGAGLATSSKREMIEWAYSLYPDISWLKSKSRLIDANEHIADSIGAVHAGIKTDQFKGIISFF